MYLRNGRYYTDFYDKEGRRVRKSLETTKKEVAKKREKELKKKIINFAADKKEILFFSDFKEWYLNFTKENRAQGTFVIHKLALKYLKEYTTPLFLRDISPEFLFGLKNFLLQKAKTNKYGHPGPAGRNRTLLALKSMMRIAEKMGKIGIKQNWEMVELDKNENTYRTEWHTLEELAQIGKVMKKHGDLFTAFLLGWEEGLRRGEIAFLHKTDYNPTTHTITIRKKPEWKPKTRKSERTFAHLETSVLSRYTSFRRRSSMSPKAFKIPCTKGPVFSV